MKDLQVLVLGDNQLSNLPTEIFNGLEELQFLNVDGNRLHTFPYLTKVKNLQSLFLEKNLIQYIDEDFLKKLPKLTDLSLGLNIITQIHPNAFNHPNNLRMIDLSMNSISHFDMKMDQLYHLTSLDLEFNFLSDLSEGVFSSCTSLADLRLDGNNFSEFSYVTDINLNLHRCTVGLTKNPVSCCHFIDPVTKNYESSGAVLNCQIDKEYSFLMTPGTNMRNYCCEPYEIFIMENEQPSCRPCSEKKDHEVKNDLCQPIDYLEREREELEERQREKTKFMVFIVLILLIAVALLMVLSLFGFRRMNYYRNKKKDDLLYGKTPEEFVMDMNLTTPTTLTTDEEYALVLKQALVQETKSKGIKKTIPVHCHAQSVDNNQNGKVTYTPYYSSATRSEGDITNNSNLDDIDDTNIINVVSDDDNELSIINNINNNSNNNNNNNNSINNSNNNKDTKEYKYRNLVMYSEKKYLYNDDLRMSTILKDNIFVLTDSSLESSDDHIDITPYYEPRARYIVQPGTRV
eukprot:Pgem_evm1s603